MISKRNLIITIVSLIVILVLLPTNRVNAVLPIIDPDALRQDDLELSDLNLLQASSTPGPWTDVPGSLSEGFTMQLDPSMEYYYFDVANLVVNHPLANNLYPFFLDTSSLPADFYTYWEAKGVTASSSGGWEEIMWDIITGIEPMLYLKVDGPSYDLVDGLQYLASGGTLEEPLRVNGNYPLGTFTFNGTVDDGLGHTDDIVLLIIFVSPLDLSDLDLLASTNKMDWTTITGNLGEGFTLLLDPIETYYYLDVENIVVNRPLANGLFPYYLDTASLPSDFYTYWEAKGVTASASGGWEEIMWDIITGTEPMFYIKVDGASYDLVDGLQYLASSGTVEEPLRVNGDYPLGVYIFEGAVADDFGYTDDVSVSITFNDKPTAHDQSLSTDEDTALVITMTASDQYPGSLVWDYSQPEHGTVTGTAPNATYYPDENWYGSDSFSFTVDDEHYGMDTGVISITVDPVNDPPTAYAQSVKMLVDTSFDITLVADDVEGGPLSWYRGEPSQGSISGVAPDLTYTPNAGYTGPDSFIFWVEDAEFDSDHVPVSIMVYGELEVTEVNLQQSTDKVVWDSVFGDLITGYKMDLDTTIEYYYLDVVRLVVNRQLADNLYPFYIDTSSLPAGFYPYWEARGVTESASGGWEEIMWNIITGIEPMFYLKVDGTSYGLIDGLQYLASSGTIEEPLRVNGDYCPGMYAFVGVVSDELGYTDELTIELTLNDIPAGIAQSLTTEINTGLGIVLSVVDHFGEPLQYEITTEPLHGTLSGTLPNISYDPYLDFLGTDSFEFVVTDAHGAVSQAVVISIRVHEPACLTVDPSSLEQTLIQDTSDSQLLSLTNSCSSSVDFSLIATISMHEGFEDGIMPPAGGWITRHDGTTINHWTIADAEDYPDFVFDGAFAAWINWHPDLEANEWLFTPVIDTTSINGLSLSFMAYSDTVHPTANLRIWVIDEEFNPVEIVWDMGSEEDWVIKEYREVLVDLSDYDGIGFIRIGWQYYGTNGQSFGLDLIEINSESTADWLSADPSEGTISPSTTQDIQVLFDLAGLGTGFYFAALEIENSPYPEIKVPVRLEVKGDDLYFYIPLIFR